MATAIDTGSAQVPYKYREPKITRAQVRVVLDFMGIPFKQQGKTAAENRARLALELQNDPVKYMAAMDIVFFKEKPSSIEVRSDTFYSEWGLLIEEYFDDGSDIAKSQLKTEADNGVAKINSHTREVCNALDTKGTEMWQVLKQEVQKEIHAAAEQYKTIAVKVGSGKPVPIEGLVHECFSKLLQLAQQRKNIMLVGPAGSGKSFVAPQIAKALKYTTGAREGEPLDYSEQSCTAGMSETVFSGWLLPIGESGRFHYVSSEFVRIYENGGVFLLDEMDAADPNVMVFINSALAGDHFVLPQRFENPMVKKHPDFICIAACNTFGAGADTVYHGRNALDGATLDRFRIGIIQFDYSPAVEEKLINPDVLLWGRSIRSMISNHKLKRIMSTRFLIDASSMINNQDWDMDECKLAYFSDWSLEEVKMVGG